MDADDALAQALGLLGRARLAIKRTGGGRLERAFLLEEARKMFEEAKAALGPDAARNELLREIEAALVSAEKDLATE